MMRGASSDVVGLVIPDIRNSFYSTIAHELSKIWERRDSSSCCRKPTTTG